MPAITINNETFEIASEETRIASEYIHKVWLAAGKPTALINESAWKVMDALIQVWGGCYPHELEAWKQNLVDEQSVERTPHEANKTNGGYFPISYPTRLFDLIKVYFKHDQLADRALIKKFIQRYPILKRTKYKI